MDMALNGATAKENSGHQPDDDPVVAKLQSRWKSALKKASTQTGEETVNVKSDADDLIGGAERAFAYTSERSETTPQFAGALSAHDLRPAGFENFGSRWNSLRPSQLRKVDRDLARMQQCWLAPAINGYFTLNEQSVEWRLTLPQPIINPVTIAIGYQPMTVDECVDLSPDEIQTPSKPVKSTGFSLLIGAQSFLLNWIPAPWHTLSADAKHALLQIALSPLVEALGLALGDHWHLAAIDEHREKGEQEAKVAHAGALNVAMLNSTSSGAATVVLDEAAKILIGVSFRRASVDQMETATLSVPEIWLERFLVQRHAGSGFCSINSLLAARPNMGDMQHTLPLIVGELALDVQSVRELEMGDVIFFAVHQGSLADLWRSHGLKARIDAPSAIIELTLNCKENAALVGGIFPRPARHPAGRRVNFLDSNADAPHFSLFQEPHQSPMKNTPSSETPTVADHLATLPIAITIEVGELSMPLNALSDIAVGTTLALAKPLDEHLLTIRANGQAIAFGELVMLDNEVGVRVNRLSSLVAPNVDRTGDQADDTHDAAHAPAHNVSASTLAHSTAAES